LVRHGTALISVEGCRCFADRQGRPEDFTPHS
jgi:hypothetical protein